jgi:hypothetical protein
VYVSFDAGMNWQSLQLNLPVVPIHDLVVRGGDLAAATHGRSFWILDNVELLQQFDQQSLGAASHLFQPRPTIRFRQGVRPTSGFSASASADGRNPPNGVVIPYYFGQNPGGEVTLRILAGSQVIRSFSSEHEEAAPRTGFGGGAGGDRIVAAEAGANRFVWDMRYPGADVLPDAVFQGRSDGPLAAPGTYRVELTAAGRTLSQSFEIVRDPRIEYTDADLVAQFEFLIAVRNKLSETMDVVRKIREMRGEAERQVERAGGSEELDRAMGALNDKLYPLEERLVQYRARAGQDLIAHPTGIDSKLARLLNFASMADAPPTQGALDLLQRLSDGIAERAAALEVVERNEYAALLRLARALVP